MKLKKQYERLSEPIKASVWFIISNIIIRGMSFITLPIFSHLLSTSEYGTVSVYQSWVSIISIITTLTIWGGVFNVGMIKYENHRDEMISSFQGLATLITLIFAMVSVLILPVMSKITKLPNVLVVTLFADILTQIPFNIWATEQRYLYKYKKLVIITLLISISNPILGYFAVTHFEDKAVARIISGIIVPGIVGVVLFIFIQRKGKKFYSKVFWQYAFRFNIVLVPHYLSTQVLNQSDRVMIDSLCGKSDTGIYSVAYSFAMLLSLITGGINSSLTPYIYQKVKENDIDQLRQQVSSVLWLVAFITIAFVAFIPDVFTFLLPDSYYPALKVIPPVTLGAFFLFIYPLFGAIEFYFEENKYVTYASIGGAILNIILNFIFIRVYGFIAAAYTTFFCYLCFTVFHYFFMKKVCKKHMFTASIYDEKNVLYVSLAVIVSSLLITAVYDYQWIRWAIILCVMLVMFIRRKYILNIVRVLVKKD